MLGPSLSPTHQSNVVNEAIANDRDETLPEVFTVEVAIVVAWVKRLMQEGKGDDGIDVEDNSPQDGHPDQCDSFTKEEKVAETVTGTFHL